MGTPGKETTAGQSRKTNGGIIGFEFSLNLFEMEEYVAIGQRQG